MQVGQNHGYITAEIHPVGGKSALLQWPMSEEYTLMEYSCLRQLRNVGKPSLSTRFTDDQSPT